MVDKFIILDKKTKQPIIEINEFNREEQAKELAEINKEYLENKIEIKQDVVDFVDEGRKNLFILNRFLGAYSDVEASVKSWTKMMKEMSDYEKQNNKLVTKFSNEDFKNLVANIIKKDPYNANYATRSAVNAIECFGDLHKLPNIESWIKNIITEDGNVKVLELLEKTDDVDSLTLDNLKTYVKLTRYPCLTVAVVYLFLGLNQDEIINLEFKDVHEDKIIVRNGQKFYESEPKDRVIKIDSDTYEFLNMVYSSNNPHNSKYAVHKISSTVDSKFNDGQITIGYLRRIIQDAIKELTALFDRKINARVIASDGKIAIYKKYIAKGYSQNDAIKEALLTFGEWELNGANTTRNENRAPVNKTKLNRFKNILRAVSLIK